VVETVIQNFGDAYPELKRNQASILSNITREEERFQRTVDAGSAGWKNCWVNAIRARNGTGWETGLRPLCHPGLPLEITRDIAREKGLDVDEAGFRQAMEEHRLRSGAGKAFALWAARMLNCTARRCSSCKNKAS